tara:strand:- start:2266 stop:2565 length:300 start_codon:yes stop_codon:yes gene_type:complete
MSAELKTAIVLVRTKALAPLARAYANHPRDHRNFYAEKCRARAEEAETEVIETLRAEGAEIDLFEDGRVRIRLAGVAASSRLGLRKTLQNWKSKAEAKR